MFERETDLAINAAKQAAEILKYNFRAVKEIKRKADGSMVSNADIAAENQIIELIEENYHEYNIIGEESGEKNKGSDFTFIIDPLDGTHNYIAGIPYYGISIGLLDREKPIMGVALGAHDSSIYNVHSSWDVAATKVIVEEAGGKLTDFKGNDFSLEIKNSVCS